MKPIVMYGKYTVIYLEVTSKLLSEERRLDSEKNASTIENALVIKEGKKKNFEKVVCLDNLGTSKSVQKVELVRQMSPAPKLT